MDVIESDCSERNYITTLQLKPNYPAHIELSLADFLFWYLACVCTTLHAVIIIVIILYNDVVCTEFRRRREGSPGDGEGPRCVRHLHQVFRQQARRRGCTGSAVRCQAALEASERP